METNSQSIVDSSAFLQDLQAILPSSRIFRPGHPAIQRFSNSTLPDSKNSLTPQSFLAVVQPTSGEEVQQIVSLAGKHSVALYPVSTGKNWGYGCASPVISGCAIVDLSQMNSIVEINSELAYAVVEPGVTMAQVRQALEDRGLPLQIDVSGSGPTTSILGNAIERGYGLGQYGDHFASICGMEIVLPNAEILRTGLWRFDGVSTAHVYKWGVGPYIDGLFSQSNFGVVTKIGIWLQPRPEHIEICLAQCEDHSQLQEIVGAVRTLLLEDTVRTRVNILSRNRLLTLYEQYPWAEMNEQIPLSDEVAAKLARRHMIGSWNVMFGLYGTAAQVRASKKRVKQVLKPFTSKLVVASDKQLDFLEKIASPISKICGLKLDGLFGSLRLALSIYAGNPTLAGLNTPYWRNRTKYPPIQDRDPSRDNCGIVWFAPIIEMNGQAVNEFTALASEICRRHGFEFAPTFTAVNARAFDCSLPILYDREDSSECVRAEECYRELSSRCIEAGFVPYRLGIQAMESFNSLDDAYTRLVRAIKVAIDPEDIISPGRYTRTSRPKGPVIN